MTSDETSTHNCIAYAFGDETRCYWPVFSPDFYWPPNIPKVETLDAFKKLFKSIGYGECEDGELKIGFEKIAIFCDKMGKPTHASKLCFNGKWKSKLGRWFDIEHTRDAVSGGLYGEVTIIMQRQIKT